VKPAYLSQDGYVGGALCGGLLGSQHYPIRELGKVNKPLGGGGGSMHIINS